MARGKGGGDDWGKILLIFGIGLGAFGLYYLTAGREEKDAALLPNRLEDQVDLVVRKLNERFGHGWVNLGLNALELYLKTVLPWEVVRLVGAIYQVEQLSSSTQMNGQAKQQTAVDWIQRGIA